MGQPKNVYFSFLIRIWLEDQGDKGEARWHIELETIQTSQKVRFPNIEAMFDFFREQIRKKVNME